MDEILAIILKDTYSLSQLKTRLRILKSNLLKTFFGNSEEDVPITVPDLSWLKSLPAEFYQRFNKDNVYQTFSNIEKEIPNLKILTIHLAFEPDDITLNQISAYARNTFSASGLLLDIKQDSALIAGAALTWKGVYKDYSLRAKLDTKKGEILQEFKKFLR
ncbi:MAG: hypothetical protein ACD_38C00060G0003 [uncultured bacterium]|uniref:F-type ATPase subunit delta n=1 Tax=Candidatus Daviesbacteria bacterium GW2011_GWC2_40_12 TaxID=1618431 RepID=A0A0G0QMH4_9BACT|nr:MAG: hypothetical protein ACD_38C00060G0003 [uncultured bacterium]KKQ82596.1 MAG: hypothetical protein UT04_C0055G0007 [Candidatus Daviesbacteria bacterium GW2011_GWF2_38_7]KKR16477.1 MAG: hypothetical protein UT45_C0005G0006 [Candidatus Daviesbacteria bacterium GW2011_GWA2_39_33]KKR22886.1 MAG: hypothetical protein UT54_C0060G0004 [Candidatus Daviesbacteria bacterium GW2011_GWB1_39_5]KKR41348.1 MAG: hypothetical protein UT77_C0013G0018 [Candidatus Daviesbacteria bacterium GW2011_GWC2_40_12]